MDGPVETPRVVLVSGSAAPGIRALRVHGQRRSGLRVGPAPDAPDVSPSGQG